MSRKKLRNRRRDRAVYNRTARKVNTKNFKVGGVF